MAFKIIGLWRLGEIGKVEPNTPLARIVEGLRTLERVVERIQLYIEAFLGTLDDAFIINPDRATSGKRVGIGTSTPSTDVDISGNLALNGALPGTNANGALVLTSLNSTAPTSANADTVQLFCGDVGGSGTLGIYQEIAVASEAVVSDRTLQVKINGTTYKLLLKS